MRKIIQSFLTILILCFVCSVVSVPVYAMIPYKTYSYSYWGEVKESPHAYAPYKVLDGVTLGTGKLVEPSDIFVDNQQNVYIADTGNHRILCFDTNLQYLRQISEFENPNKEGGMDKLNMPSGVFVTDEGKVYIADTENSRIVITDNQGKLLKIVPQPQSEVFPEGFIYKPSALVVDKAHRIYVVAKSTNMGVIAMNEEGKFEGFMGAQKVTPNLGDVFWKFFATKEQKDRMIKFVPTEYNNISIDRSGFLFVTSSSIAPWNQYAVMRARLKGSEHAPIKRLNPTGADILKRNGFFPPAGDVDVRFGYGKEYGPSTFIDVTIQESGIYSILDSKRNKIFTYDEDGNLLYAFGGSGTQFGVFKSAVSIAYQGANLLVLDRGSNKITIMKITDYGASIAKAIIANRSRQYETAVDVWKEILDKNSNFDLAYVGMGKSFLKQKKYAEAMEYFKLSNDWQNYSKAFRQLRKQYIGKYILLLPLGILLLILLWSAFSKYVRRVNLDGQQRVEKRKFKDELLYAFHIIYHPFDGFYDLKHEKRGSLRAAIGIVVLLVLTFIFRKTTTGYIFNPFEGMGFDLVSEILTVLIPIGLWCLANWCLTTLMDGEGSFKDIFITTAYGLMPMILIHIPVTIASNFLIIEESAFITFFMNLSYGWTLFLLFIGVMMVHNYSLLKNLITSALSVAGMGVIMFIALLFLNLLQKMVAFFTNLGVEVMYRM